MPVADGARSFYSLNLLSVMLALGTALFVREAWPADAVVLLYHHVDAETPAATSVRPASFDRHLDYLERGGFNVVELSRIVDAVTNGSELPENAVALTFDDAYRSIYTAALPRLERRGWAFTVFVATQPIDRGYATVMTWDELRDLEARGGTIANHGADHSHLVRRESNESTRAWRRRVEANILAAQARLDAELAHPSTLFAYPYGEFDSALEHVVADLGLVAFGQQSGAIGSSSGLQQLARYPMATGYDSIESLAEKLRTRALPVEALGPDSRVLPARADAPTLRLRLPAGPYRRDAMRCYVEGQDPATIVWDGDVAAIRAQRPMGGGRHKYNCTAPSTAEPGVYYWYSHLWIQPLDDGSWYAE